MTKPTIIRLIVFQHNDGTTEMEIRQVQEPEPAPGELFDVARGKIRLDTTAESYDDEAELLTGNWVLDDMNS